MGSRAKHGAAGRPRSLTEREREILNFLLSAKTPGVEELREQAQVGLATPWTCGCASIDISVDRAVARPSPIRARPAIEAESKERPTPSGCSISCFGVDDDGWLSAIEIVDYLERHEDSPAAIPPPTDFRPPRAT